MYDASNVAMIQVMKGEGKRLKMTDKLLREIAAPPERPPYAVAQAAVATFAAPSKPNAIQSYTALKFRLCQPFLKK